METRNLYIYMGFCIIWLIWFIYKQKLYKKLPRLFIVILGSVFVPIGLFIFILYVFLLFGIVPVMYKIPYLLGSTFIFILSLLSIIFSIYNGLFKDKNFYSDGNMNKIEWKHILRMSLLVTYIFSVLLLYGYYDQLWYVFVGVILFCTVFISMIFIGIDFVKFFGIDKIDRTERRVQKIMVEKNIKPSFYRQR